MKLSSVALLGAASLAAAQGQPSLADTLSSESDLSTLNTLLVGNQQILRSLGQRTNITILAPSNAAIQMYLNNTANPLELASNPEMLTALLDYHVLNGTWGSDQIQNTSVFIASNLGTTQYSNVTGGQVVEASKTSNGTVTFFSGLKENSTVIKADVQFNGGILHIVDHVLTLPDVLFEVLRDANLTASAGAIRKAGAETRLNDLQDVTVFAPDNEAFNKIGNLTGFLTVEQLGKIMDYHVVQGKVLYSTDLENMSLDSVEGSNLTISNLNGTLYVNTAKIVVTDVLAENGVVHIIDGVLNPDNEAPAVPTATSQSPGFTATTGSSGVPFTSGIEGPTSTAPANPGAVTSTQTGEQAAPTMHGAMGAAALFGGAAIFMNM